MLSISQPRSASSAASYYLHLEKDSRFERGEYYFREGDAAEWMGNGANHLGLEGTVSPEIFRQLADGFGPSGQSLAKNAGEPERRAGWDLTFSAPKSVSVAWSVADPATREAIERAHQAAVRESFALMQDKAGYARTGAQGKEIQRADLVAAAFQHGTSREQDAQLHTHVFVFNAGICENGHAASLDSSRLYDWKMAVGAAYQAQLAHELGNLGYQLERDGEETFRIAVVPRALEEAQSTRRTQIEAELARTGQSGAKASATATLKTRQAKGDVNLGELRKQWSETGKAHGFTPAMARPDYQSETQKSLFLTEKGNHHEHQITRAGSLEPGRGLPIADPANHAAHGHPQGLRSVQSLNSVRALPGGRVDAARGGRAALLLPRDAQHRLVAARTQQVAELRRAAVTRDRPDMPSASQVLEKATERDAVVTQAQIVTAAMRASITAGSAAQAEAVAKRAEARALELTRKDGQKGHPRMNQYTDKNLMKAERDVIRIAIERKGENWHTLEQKHIEAALMRTAENKGYMLNTEQRAAVEKLGGTPGGVQVMVGDAGTGKSSTMYAVREAHEAAGLRIIGTSTGGKASAELMQSSGIQSRSIAKLRSDLERGKETLDRRSVLVIDEAGMTGSRDMATLMRAANDAGAKVILVGDHKQLSPVAAGETFKALDTQLGSARLEQISRQNQEWERGTVKELSRGEASQAIKTYAEQNRIHVNATYDKAIKDVATRHVQNMREVGADKTVALAATNHAVDAINRQVRSELVKDGQLKDAHAFTTQDKDRNSGQREIELAKGDRVMTASGDAKAGYLNGDAGRVVDMDTKTGTISMRLDRTGETVQIKTETAELRHGYAMTTHKAQGSTYDRATVYLDSNTSRELSYVQASRAREETHFVSSAKNVREMQTEAVPSPRLIAAVEKVAQTREAAGKDAGLESDTKQNMRAALDYIKDNKAFTDREVRTVAALEGTLGGLAEAMGRERPKETTLDYRVVPRSYENEKERQFRADLDKLDRALEREKAQTKEHHNTHEAPGRER